MPKPPRWFLVVAVVALLWNVLGCIAIASDLSMTPADVAKLPPGQQALHAARPAWAVSASVLAVLGGAIGSFGLALARRWANPVLLVSLIGIIGQDLALVLLARDASLVGPVAVVLQALVLAIGIGLVVLGRAGARRGWLR
jgi:hypothetical protein